jgi:serine protease Do
MNSTHRIIGLVLLVTIPVSLIVGGIGSVIADRIMDTVELSDENGTTIIRREEVVEIRENSAIIEAVELVSPSVVSIVISTNALDFFGNVTEQRGGGTGFIITDDGLILTNKHVVQRSTGGLRVITSSGQSYDARVISEDPSNDLAVIKIDATDLPVVTYADSNAIQVGQQVVAIGNALGQYQNTVTAGVISAKDRTLTVSARDGSVTERLEGVIQTDAAINPGNSGGPLINLSGEVVGINTAVDAGGQTIGFAIPINVAIPAIETVIEEGEIIRPFLGVRYIPLTNEIAELNNLDIARGALIQRGANMTELAVMPGSPADRAGLRENDIIIAIDGDEITESRGLVSLLQQHKPGDEIDITYIRAGEEQTTTAILAKTGE